jgi:hypothetical protein
MKHCKICSNEIPAARLKALPTAQTCVKCSSTTKYIPNIVQHGSFEDDGFQELDVIRDVRDQQTYLNYYNQLGQFKNQ